MTRLPREFFARSVHEVAPDLIGVTLLVDGVGGTIVEVEAYDQEDPAAHSFRGKTARNASMFGPPGHAYVYRSYGIHWCLNFVCEPEGVASAVLVRALEPVRGLDEMRAPARAGGRARCCAPGPGRLCQALGITREHDGLPLDEPPFEAAARAREEPEIATGPRIGITQAADRPWRYVLAGSRYLSRSAAPTISLISIPGEAATPPRGAWNSTRPHEPLPRHFLDHARQQLRVLELRARALDPEPGRRTGRSRAAPCRGRE